MAQIIKIKAEDGSDVEFYDEIKAQGGIKDVYFSPSKKYVVAFYRKTLKELKPSEKAILASPFNFNSRPVSRNTRSSI